jgi:hypothetical protein
VTHLLSVVVGVDGISQWLVRYNIYKAGPRHIRCIWKVYKTTVRADITKYILRTTIALFRTLIGVIISLSDAAEAL